MEAALDEPTRLEVDGSVLRVYGFEFPPSMNPSPPTDARSFRERSKASFSVRPLSKVAVESPPHTRRARAGGPSPPPAAAPTHSWKL